MPFDPTAVDRRVAGHDVGLAADVLEPDIAVRILDAQVAGRTEDPDVGVVAEDLAGVVELILSQWP